MSKITYMKRVPGELTIEHIISALPETVLYILGCNEYFKIDKDPNINTAQMRTLQQHAKMTGTFQSRTNPDALFAELMTLDGIGYKSALVLVIAITGKLPDLRPVIVNLMLRTIFDCADPKVLGRDTFATWGMYELSTTQPYQPTLKFIRAKMGFLIAQFNLQPKYAISVDAAIADVIAQLVLNERKDLCTTKTIITREHKFVDLLKQENTALYSKQDVEKWIAEKADYLDDDQRKAMISFLSDDKKVYLLVGIAGSGKSAVIQCLWEFLRSHGNQALITSFMNKAVHNLKERIPDYTIGEDRMRGYVATAFKINFCKPENPWLQAVNDCKYLIIDECSVMSSLHLNYILTIIRNMAPNVRILMVGDPQQLHPVCEHGYPFNRACELNTPLMLTGFHRSNGHDIKRIADKVRYNKCLSLNYSDEVNLLLGSEQSAIKSIIDQYSSAKNVTEFGCIAPTVELCAKVNEACFKEFAPEILYNEWAASCVGKPNHHKPKIPALWVGARIIVDTAVDVSDGEQLVKNQLLMVKSCNKLFCVLLGDNGLEHRVLASALVGCVSLSYCITVHKSQGSESNVCVYLTPKDAFGMAIRFYRQQNLVYVAITRAKEKLIIYELEDRTNKPAFEELGAIFHQLVSAPERMQTF